ncbi:MULTISPECIES: hypothetical protein [unclassified Cryobacterium]|uniref:hypothetical protein n=1 Tax=unclassified Cryobacterium TaxID=2649013 RepID=UPI002AB560D2|nr:MULTISPECIES: hypothetical protein [unclassified Cryobacterium]MDY7528253.1 hypothetical protein [Cryobacterium sp. 10C2]MDY7556000.1 hypothetical protein [Cryobacterium sp. 10C3]MEB0003974.1 hypothetical protein [Cryobacterium sp. RTC2.1]MEB0290488.1 hypothetical protein [Cryobacterium sp. 10C2]
MQQFLYILPALICPVGMGLMMWLMMRGRGHGHGHGKTVDGPEEQELARLRAEVAALRPHAAAFDERHPGTGPTA